MANVTVRHLLDMAVEVLQDANYDNWTETEFINWYNLIARQAVVYAPDANPVIEPILLGASAKHVIPAAGLALINVIRNMGADGETPGAAITPSTIQMITAFDKNWTTATSAAVIKHFMPETKRTWYSYPPSNGAGYIEIEYSKVPSLISYDADGDWESALVGVTDDYVFAVLEGILWKAFSKDTDFPGNQERSGTHMNAFLQAVGAPKVGQQMASPQGA